MEEQVYGRRYRVTEKIGSGGMADVYKAVDETLGRTVAVKVLHPRYAADPTFVARFRQEAQAAANLSNPHIVNIYDWGQEDSTYYIVMEYVRGTDLKTLIDEKGPVDPTKAAEYAAQVCSALAAAHGYDIVHRDIKPHNIVLMPDGTVKVMDFGIARAGNTTMTQTGSVLGTAQYISPEQAQGRPIGPSSDLYSLGVVLYELTTGRLPFTGDTPVAVALKQVNEQPVPPRQLDPAIPPALEAVILRAMQKDPSVRYASAEEMRDDLRRVVAGQPVAAAPAGAGETSVMPVVGAPAPVPVAPRRVEERPRYAAWAWVLALIALVLVGGLLAWMAFMQPKPVSVPDVQDLPVAEATSTLAGAGLKVGTITQQNSDSIKAGYVISQSPGPKTPIPAGTAVDLVVSSGVAKATVPDVTKMTAQNAVNALQNAHFRIGTISEQNNSAKSGYVFAQNPKAGTELPVGSPVDITVSLGPKLVTIPTLAGKTQSAATKQLEGLGLHVDTKPQADNSPKGTVLDSDPGAGGEVPVGSSVTLIVSTGPQLVTVPDLYGMSRADAQQALTDAGLTYPSSEPPSQTTTNTDLLDKVVSQSPAAGAEVSKGTQVSFSLGSM